MINLYHNTFQPVSIHDQTVLAIESTSFLTGKERLIPIDYDKICQFTSAFIKTKANESIGGHGSA